MNTFDVIKRPVITEKSTVAQQDNQYSFAVDPKANKYDITEAVEKIFSVTVTKVRTVRMPSKFKRVGRNIGKTSPWKKAIVTLKEGDRIEFLEGA